MNWLLMILSFALGGLTTWLWSVRTVTRVIPASEYDRHLDAQYDDEDDALERDGDTRDGAAGLGAAGVAGGAAGAAALPDRDRDDDYLEVDEDHGRYTERDDVAVADDAEATDDAVLTDDVEPADERELTSDEDDLAGADEAAGAHALGDLDEDDAASEGEFVSTDAEVTDDDADLDTTSVAGAGAATGVAGFAAGSQLEDEDASELGDGIEGDDDVVDPASTATGAPGTTDGDVVVVEEIEDVDGQPVGRSASDAHTEAIPMVGQGMTDEDEDEDEDAASADDLQPVDADAEYADEVDPVAPDASFLEDSEDVDGDEAVEDDAPYGPGSARSAADGSGPEGWAIKGNADSGLFHTEESPGYENTRAEVWFADEASAIAAGFRHWDRKQR